MNEIYLDNAATTKVDKNVLKKMQPYFTEKIGNASSLHHLGQESKKAIENAREIVGKSINGNSKEIIFTSGGTESNNLTLKGLAFYDEKKTGKKRNIIITKVEHDCIMNAAKWLKEKGWRITFLDVDEEGFIDINQLKKTIKKDTFLVSIIHGNNEIGTIQDLKKIGRAIKEKNKETLFHVDACQSFTKTELDVKKQNSDLVTLNGHKIHGPKGIGALYLREGVKIENLQHGGSQELNKRAGTENVPNIVGFAEAIKQEKNKDIKKIKELRDKLILGLEKIDGSKLNGPKNENRLCNNVNFVFKNVEGEAIIAHLNSKGIYCSTGSACSSKSLEPSHVLLAIGLKKQDAHGSVRLSISKYNTKKEIDYVLKVFPEIINKLRKISPFN